MATLLKELEEKANERSASVRELLANHLFQSVHNRELTELEGEWLEVVEMRFNALKDGSDKGIPEAEFFKRFGSVNECYLRHGSLGSVGRCLAMGGSTVIL